MRMSRPLFWLQRDVLVQITLQNTASPHPVLESAITWLLIGCRLATGASGHPYMPAWLQHTKKASLLQGLVVLGFLEEV